MLKLLKKAIEFSLLGLAVGLLTAPRSGMESRRLIVDRFTELLHLRQR